MTTKKETAAAGIARVDSNSVVIANLLERLEGQTTQQGPAFEMSRVDDALKAAQDARILAEGAKELAMDTATKATDVACRLDGLVIPFPQDVSEDPAFKDVYDVTKKHINELSSLLESTKMLTDKVATLTTSVGTIQGATHSAQSTLTAIQAKIITLEANARRPPLPLLNAGPGGTWNGAASHSFTPAFENGKGSNTTFSQNGGGAVFSPGGMFTSPNKRPRLEMGAGGYEVQYGHLAMDCIPMEAVRRAVSCVAGLQMGDTLRPSNWVMVDGKPVLSMRFYMMEKAQRFVAAVTGGENSEFHGRRAYLIEG